MAEVVVIDFGSDRNLVDMERVVVAADHAVRTADSSAPTSIFVAGRGSDRRDRALEGLSGELG